MHLNSALRLLGELALEDENQQPRAVATRAADLKSDTTKAMANR